MKLSTNLNAAYRTRVRLFGLSTVIVSTLWCFAANKVYRHILHLEFAGLMTGAIDMTAGTKMDLGFLSNFIGAFEAEPVVVVPPIAFIEVSAACWLAITWGVGLLLLVAGSMAQAGRKSGRKWLLCAGAGILVNTAITLLVMYILIRWGGFPPTVRPLGYVVVAMVQSGFGWALLVAHWRQPKALKRIDGFDALPRGAPAPE
jgi:hypothetical protein